MFFCFWGAKFAKLDSITWDLHESNTAIVEFSEWSGKSKWIFQLHNLSARDKILRVTFVRIRNKSRFVCPHLLTRVCLSSYSPTTWFTSEIWCHLLSVRYFSQTTTWEIFTRDQPWTGKLVWPSLCLISRPKAASLTNERHGALSPLSL